ncbi:hypothetical protein [Methanolobus sp. WCC4]
MTQYKVNLLEEHDRLVKRLEDADDLIEYRQINAQLSTNEKALAAMGLVS